MLVAIEGIDGAGKRTQCACLVERARAAGYAVEALAFPRYHETFFGAAVRELLEGGFGEQPDPRLVGLLFAGDRLETKAQLERALSSSDLVVADRYVASNLAYQAARSAPAERNAVMAWLGTVEYEVFALPRPALTVVLDLPVELACRRVSARAQADASRRRDRYEVDPALLEAARAAYLRLARDEATFALIGVQAAGGAPRSAEEIAEEIWSAVVPLLAPAAGPRAQA